MYSLPFLFEYQLRFWKLWLETFAPRPMIQAPEADNVVYIEKWRAQQ